MANTMDETSERIRIKDIAKMSNVSVGTVDRVLHNRGGVSKENYERVKSIMDKLHYRPNMYASALASNKKYLFGCLLPIHKVGEYWTAVEDGIQEAIKAYSDFNISITINYYDPFKYSSFLISGNELLAQKPDGVMLTPSDPKMTEQFTTALRKQDIPYIFLDFNMPALNPLAFYGQNSVQSGYLAAKFLMLMAGEQTKEVAVFRQIKDGIIGSNQQEHREVGFRQYMKEHFSECKILSMDVHNRDFKEERTLELFFKEHPNITNGITFNSKAYIIGEFLEKHQFTAFNLMGYDLLKRNVVCLKKGSISMIIAQKPEDQGYRGVSSLCDHLILKKTITPINYMPIDLLTAENIDFYMNFPR